MLVLVNWYFHLHSGHYLLLLVWLLVHTDLVFQIANYLHSNGYLPFCFYYIWAWNIFMNFLVYNFPLPKIFYLTWAYFSSPFIKTNSTFSSIPVTNSYPSSHSSRFNLIFYTRRAPCFEFWITRDNLGSICLNYQNTFAWPSTFMFTTCFIVKYNVMECFTI